MSAQSLREEFVPILPASNKRCATRQIVIVGFLAFCGPGLFNALQGLGNAGSDSAAVAALANSCLYITFAISGYFSGAAFNLMGAKPLLTVGGLTYALYAVCIYFTPRCQALAAVGGCILGVGAGLFWTAQGSLMMAYATPDSRGRLIALFWIIFNFGGVVGGLLQFGLNFDNASGNANPASYFVLVATMFAGAFLAPCVLADPACVVREDGTTVAFKPADSPLEEIRAAFGAIGDPFIRCCLPFFLASSWANTYNFSGFNGAQFNMRTRGLNSSLFWGAQMLAAWLFGKLVDAQAPPRVRAYRGASMVVLFVATSVGLALWQQLHGYPGCPLGWDKGSTCKVDFYKDSPGSAMPMVIFVLLGAADALYQNFALWLMSSVAGSDMRKTVMYAAAYKGVQSLGAGMSWLIDFPGTISYQTQGMLTLVLTLSAMIPVCTTFSLLEHGKKDIGV